MEFLGKIVLKACDIDEVLDGLRKSVMEYNETSPSNFIAEMKLSTEERQDKIIKSLYKKKTRTTEELDLIPNVIVFQNFSIGKTQIVPLSVININKYAVALKLNFKHSPYIRIKHTDTIIPAKLASGMEMHFHVEFTPESLKDYWYKFQFITENKHYTVSVIAVGPRPLFDMPDSIILPESPVHIGTEKHVLVVNRGQVPGVFTLKTRPPFFVKPQTGILESNASMQFIIQFQPLKEGFFEDKLLLCYETGEKLVVQLQGTAQCSNIFLDKKTVYFENTYMGLKTQKVIEVQNRSDHIVKFVWKKFSLLEQDKIESQKLKDTFEVVRDYEARKSTKMEVLEVVDEEVNDMIYKRIYQDEIAEFNEKEQFFYTSPNFTIIPMEGEVWPNRSTMITIIFSPNAVEKYSSTAYCDVTGRTDRMSLYLQGTGIGAKFALNIESLDLCSIYLRSKHTFEVVVVNNGDIPGSLIYTPREYYFGSKISCVPESLYLQPFEHGVFVIHFCPTEEGTFIEEIIFKIDYSEEILKLKVQGTSVFPKVNISEPELQFDKVALGKQVMKTISLINETSVDIPFNTLVAPDGIVPALSLETCMENLAFNQIGDPKEFEIEVPDPPIVPAYSTQDITVKLIPNIVRRNTTQLMVDAWGDRLHRKNVSIHYECVVPELVFTPGEISIRFCFLNYLCQRLFVIKNRSNLYGCIHVYTSSQEGLYIETDVKTAFVEPYGVTEVYLKIICEELGKQESTLMVQLFGQEPVEACKIECIGQGPVISFIPEHLNFGHVSLLNYVSEIISVYNDSPISAELTIKTNKNAFWTVEPEKIFLESEESADLNVTVYLNDTIKYKGKILLDVLHRGILECTIVATGVGTSIKVEPNIVPAFDLGSQLTKSEVIKELKFTNLGVRFHKLIVTHSKEMRSFQGNNPEEIEPLFKFTPQYFTLRPEESIVITMNGRNNKKEKIQENFYVHAVIEGIEKRSVIIKTIILCNFVEPTLTFSKKEMHFRIDIDNNTTKAVLKDVTQITNVSSLDLKIDMQVKPPFYLVINDENLNHYTLNLADEESFYITVFFDSTSEDQHCLVIQSKLEITYQEHPHKDYIILKGEINYPNVIFIPNTLDLGCVTSNSFSCLNVEVKNISPLPVKYHFEWLEDAFYFIDIPPITIKQLPQIQEMEVEKLEYTDSSQPTEPIILMFDEENLINKSDMKKGKTSKPPKKDKKGGKKTQKPLPTELIFMHYYTETYWYDHEIQISEELHEPFSKESKIDLSERNAKNLVEMKRFLYNPIHEFLKDTHCFSILNCFITTPPRDFEINSILEIIPYHGYLAPYESQMISVTFRPSTNMCLKAKVLCHILGGPTEELEVSGMSSDISYLINTIYVDFGRQVFCEVSEKHIKLKNNGYIPFTFTTTAKEPDEHHSVQLLEMGWITVQPRTDLLYPQAEVIIQIRYFPGIAGRFLETFQLEIGHLPPVTITVTGYGVFPQVYLSIPRPALVEICAVTSYAAIANITLDFLKYVEDVNIWTCSDKELRLVEIPKEERRQLQTDGWTMISNNRVFPSTMDIDLAVERMLVYKHILHNPNILTETTVYNRFKSIPRFHAPPYVVDFGYVVRDTMAHSTVNILNYGPTRANVRIISNLRKMKFFEAGFNIQFKSTKLHIGDTIPMFILFHPPADNYKERRHNIEYQIILEVLHGPRIPINITAVVTVPFIETSVQVLDFDKVLCGQCKMMNFLITNIGFVPCSWYARIEEITISNRRESKQKSLTMFILESSYGTLQPNDYKLITIYFEPQKKGSFERKITITVEQNTEIFEVIIIGCGVKPELEIETTTLEFQPGLPYSNDSFQYFSIRNPCDFPIEYYFSDYDEQIEMEDKLIKILCLYYGTDKIYIPKRLPGEKLPPAFYQFFDDLLFEFRNIHQIQEIVENKPSIVKRKKLKKSAYGSSESLTRTAFISGKFTNKTQKEIEELATDYMLKKLEKCMENDELGLPNETMPDPLAQAIQNAKGPVPKPDPTELKEGIVFIFHGAPFTEYLYAANKIGRELNLPVVNLDNIIMEAIAYSQSVSSSSIGEIINDLYSKVAPVKETIQTQLVLSDSEKELDIFFDPLLELEKKINVINENTTEKSKSKDKKKAGIDSESKSNPSTPKSAESKKDKKMHVVDNSITYIGIPEDLLLDVIKHKIFEHKTGVVIESLNNNFIRQPVLTLKTILKACGNIRYAHGFIVYNSMEKYQAEIDAKIIDKKINEDLKVSQLLEHFDRITDEEFENLTPEQLDLYKNVYVKNRRENQIRRINSFRIKHGLQQMSQESRRKSVLRKKVKSSSIGLIKVKSGTKKSVKSDSGSSKKSSKSDKKSKKEKKVQLSASMQEIVGNFAKFDKDYEEMKHIFDFWDRKKCEVTIDLSEFKKKHKTKSEKTTAKSAKFAKSAKSSAKTSEKDKKGKAKAKDNTSTEIKIVEPKMCDSPIGIPLWVLNNISDKDKQNLCIESLSPQIQYDQIYQEAKTNLQESVIEKVETESRELTVLKKLEKDREQQESDVFTIVTKNSEFSDIVIARHNSVIQDDQDEPDDDLIDKVKSFDTILSFQPRRAHLTTSQLSRLSASISYPHGEFQKRTILYPDEKIYYRVQFAPKNIDIYNYTYTVEMTNWHKKYLIHCKACCDVPRIDMNPKIMFGNVINERSTTSANIRKCYIRDICTFDFGNILLCGTGSMAEETSQTETVFRVKNISVIPCEVKVYFLNDSDVFKSDDEILYIPPGETYEHRITACPRHMNRNTNTLLYTIKHNPKIEIINLECMGVKLHFSILNKVINFERILINHTEKKNLNLVNNSLVPLIFHFTNTELFHENYIIHPNRGVIQPNSTYDISIEYHAQQVEELPTKRLWVEIHNDREQGKPLLSDFIELTAETVDLLVDCNKTIFLGDIKARKEYSIRYTFMNNGKYSIIFSIQEIPDEELSAEDKNISKMFRVKPPYGILLPKKEFDITIKFNSYKLINIKSFPIFRCSLLDHISKNVLSTFDVTATLKTFYSQFTIYPTNEINFGPMLIDTQSIQRLTITNTGNLGFNYTVLTKKQLDEIQARLTALKNKKSKSRFSKSDKGSSKSKSTDSSKSTKGSRAKKSIKSKGSKSKGSGSKNKSAQGPSLACGPFTIKNSKNFVMPEEKAELQIECIIKEVGIVTETVIIFVSESNVFDRLGKIIKIQVIGCLPHVLFEDYESIFNEHYIVENDKDFVKPKEIEHHCVFVKSTKTLTFNNVCINTPASARIRLYNDSLMEAEIWIKTFSLLEYQVEPQKLFIPSYSYGYFTIIFTPTAIQSYQANLSIQLVITGKSETVNFLLYGEGRVPQIVVKEPPLYPDTDIGEFSFCPTLVGRKVSHLISFENTGDFPCKVIVEISDDNEDVFYLTVLNDTLPLLNITDVKDARHAQMVKLIPGDIANFNLNYHPTKIDFYTCEVRVHVVNNPYETITISIFGESYSEDIVFENIPTCLPIAACSSRNSNSRSKISKENLLQYSINNVMSSSISNISQSMSLQDMGCSTSYKLDFGNVYINSLQKFKFKIINQSNRYTYKFVFRSAIKEVCFIPAVGHLKPTTHKDIFVTFLREQPVEYKNIMLLDCLICKITYLEDVDENCLSWDDRQVLIIWDDDTHSKSAYSKSNQPMDEELVEEEEEEEKVKQNKILLNDFAEPIYNVVDDTVKIITLFLSVNCAYSNYDCETEKINFEDTSLFEKRILHFDVINSGTVKLELDWKINLGKYFFGQSTSRPSTSLPKDKFQPSASRRPRPLTGKESFIGLPNEKCKQIEEIDKISLKSSCEKMHMPFTIIPESVIIPPREKVEMSVIFAPLDVFDYKASIQSKIKNLSPNKKNIHIKITAKSIMPYCYFDVTLSDYITSHRRQVRSCDDVLENEYNIKVVEFDCLGVGIKHSKIFNILNPTSEELVFSWQQIKSSEYSSVALFSCHFSSGKIESGKLTAAAFSIMPPSTGIFEALYNFQIARYHLSVPFLVVANVRESNVRFLKTSLNLKPTLVSMITYDYVILKNNEDTDLDFKFRKTSMFCEGGKQFLTVEPRKGILTKKSETKLKISFNPTDIGEEYFGLQCCIEYVKEPITLRITSKCYDVQPFLSYSTKTGKNTTLSSENDNFIDLSDLQPRHKESITFVIRNDGKIGFYFMWNINEQQIERNFKLGITEREGYIKSNTEIDLIMWLTPLKTASLRNHKIELQIKYGPTYKILINGVSLKQVFKFSFTEYDFGQCFIQTSTTCFNHKILEFFNNTINAVTLETFFKNTDFLTIHFTRKVIMPKTREQIAICFHPKAIKEYSAEIVFMFSSQKVPIKIFGEGINLEINVANINDKCIDFGSLNIGDKVKKTVKVINKSNRKVEAIFDLHERLPFVLQPLRVVKHHYINLPANERLIPEEEPEKKIVKKGILNTNVGSKTSKKKTSKTDFGKSGSKKSDRKSSIKSKKSKESKEKSLDELEETPEQLYRKLINSVITVVPKTFISIEPQETAKFDIIYFPNERMVSFTETIYVQVQETVQPLCVIKCCCLGSNLYLDRDTVSFGVVVQNCTKQTRIILVNDGEIGSSFRWDLNQTTHFSISPISGYAGPGTKTTFTITFCPNKVDVQYTSTMQCVLDKGKKTLIATLIGFCVDLPPPHASVEFDCPVRTEDKKSVILLNSSVNDWNLTPTITGDEEYFSCNNTVFVEAKSNAICEVTYKPLTMTKLNCPHKGLLYFKTPEGYAMVFDLIGKADKPTPIKVLYLEVPAKSEYVELLKVQNWLPIKQKFKIGTEDITQGSNSNLYEIRGYNSIDIDGNEEITYEWKFYAYKECSLVLRVVFINDNKEYMFYQLTVKVVKCGIMDTINLTTCIRTPKIYNLTLINPLESPVTYKLFCNLSFITYPNTVTVEAHSETNVPIEFNPIVIDIVRTTLEAQCVELGSYVYEFILTSLPPATEEALIFHTTLGVQQVLNAKITNLTKIKTSFTCTFNDNESIFQVSKSLTAAPSQSIEFPITFVPNNIGKFNSRLIISSPTSGEFIFPLTGTCEHPKPKGPYFLKPYTIVAIKFVNPFLNEMVFTFKVTPNVFSIKSQEALIKPKSSTDIIVSMIEINNIKLSGDVTGKLTIRSKEKSLENIKWVYFLQGKLPNS